MKIPGSGLLMLILLPVAAIGYWVTECPCGRVPGISLPGKFVEDKITDWRFANLVQLCQLQVHKGFLPHSVNLNCYASEAGDLYLSCGECEGKYWSESVLANPAGRIRLSGFVYPVEVRRITEPAAIEEAWVARQIKFPTGDTSSIVLADSFPPEGWWVFAVSSR